MKTIILLLTANILFGYVDYQSNYLINNQKEGININTANWGWYDQTGKWGFEFYENMSYIAYHSKYNISLEGKRKKFVLVRDKIKKFCINFSNDSF